jgi:mRNA interferase MazF
MVIQQRDIVLIPFPFTDGSGSKRRPVLVISCDSLNNDYKRSDFIGAAITSRPREGDYSVAIDIQDYERGTLDFPSEIQCDKIFTLLKSKTIKKLCTLKAETYSRVQSTVRRVFGL